MEVARVDQRLAVVGGEGADGMCDDVDDLAGSLDLARAQNER